MARNKTAQGGISLRRKVTAWLAAILLVTMLSTGIATMAGQWTVRSFDTLLADNALCYTVQNALKDETQAFARYVRQPTSETEQAYTAACAAAEQSLAALPFDYARIGEERYARTWNLLQGYAGYRQERDAFLQLSCAGFEYERPELEGVIRYVGPLLPPRIELTPPPWWERLDERPLVIVSQGTLANVDLGQLLLPAMQGLAGDELQLLLTTGGRDPARLGAAVPANAIVTEHVPFELALPRAAVLVTNGGYGSVQAALAQPDVKKRLLELNLNAQGSTPAQLGEHLAADVRRWSDVIAKAKIARQ